MNRKYKYKIGQKIRVKSDEEILADPIFGKVGTIIEVGKDYVIARFEDVFNGSNWWILKDDIIEIIEG